MNSIVKASLISLVLLAVLITAIILLLTGENGKELALATPARKQKKLTLNHL